MQPQESNFNKKRSVVLPLDLIGSQVLPDGRTCEIANFRCSVDRKWQKDSTIEVTINGETREYFTRDLYEMLHIPLPTYKKATGFREGEED